MGNLLDNIRRDVTAASKMLVEGDAKLQAGDLAAALNIFGRLETGVLCNSPILLARMARCYLALGDTNRVFNVSSALLRRDPADVDALILRAEAQFQTIPEDIDSDAWAQKAE